MKKNLFKIGFALAIVTLMAYNVQIATNDQSTGMNLAAIRNAAFADSEKGPLCSNGSGTYCCKYSSGSCASDSPKCSSCN